MDHNVYLRFWVHLRPIRFAYVDSIVGSDGLL
jgi:hypothetical protein